MPNYYYGYSPFFGFFDLVWHVLLIIFIIWVLMWLFRRGPSRRRMYDMWSSHSAMSILNERFAKGEISKEEYEERKRALLS